MKTTFVCLALGFAFAPIASPQARVAWTGGEAATHGEQSIPDEVVPVAAGGVVTLHSHTTGPYWFQSPWELHVRRFDDEGNLLWSRDEPIRTGLSHYQMLSEVAYVESGIFAFVMTQDTDNERVLCIDPDGNTVSDLTFTDPLGFHPKEILLLSNGDLLMSGNRSNQPVIQRIATDGTVLWETNLPADQGSPSKLVVQEAHGIYAVTGGLTPSPNTQRAHRLTLQGTLLWSSNLPNSEFQQYFYLAVIPSGEVQLTHNRNGNNPQGLFLSRLAPNGAFLEIKRVDIEHPLVIPAPNGDFISMFGRTRRYDNLGNLLWESPQTGVTGKRYAAKFDALGRLYQVGYAGSFPGSPALWAISPNGSPLYSIVFDTTLPGTAFRLGIDHRQNPVAGWVSWLEGPDYWIQTRHGKVVEWAPLGSSYCIPSTPNSQGLFAQADLFGSPESVRNNATLTVGNLPPGEFGFALASSQQGFLANPGGGQGNLCLGGALGRLNQTQQIQAAGPAGTIEQELPLQAMPQPTGTRVVLAGETWNFQWWYRDTNPVSTSNLSNGVSFSFQ